MSYITDEEFIGIDFNNQPLESEFESCNFIDCRFPELDLSNKIFSQCTFDGCDLGNIKVQNTAFQDVFFLNCKMIGIHFFQTKSMLLEMKFEGCQLDYSSFKDTDLRNTPFQKCQMHEVDFTSSNLTHAKFTHCDLTNTVFADSNLSDSDFRTSQNFIIHPEKNKIANATFDLIGLKGLVHHLNINVDSML